MQPGKRRGEPASISGRERIERRSGVRGKARHVSNVASAGDRSRPDFTCSLSLQSLTNRHEQVLVRDGLEQGAAGDDLTIGIQQADPGVVADFAIVDRKSTR